MAALAAGGGGATIARRRWVCRAVPPPQSRFAGVGFSGSVLSARVGGPSGPTLLAQVAMIWHNSVGPEGPPTRASIGRFGSTD
ncbi:DUF6053 domain-containing protein [Lysobacter enzymogenes]|uniref:DUF6053 domain-containing protein n=1 Tax=Lysobacter enzymogenes TaxID=69 RepID=UPI003CCE1F8E